MRSPETSRTPIAAVSPPVQPAPGRAAPVRLAHHLGDFTTNRRLLVLTPMAVVVGVIATFVAVILVWLIGTITNLAYYQRFSSTLVSPDANHLGPIAVLIPVVGGLIVAV